MPLIKLYKHPEVQVLINTDTISKVQILTTDSGTVSKINIHFIGTAHPTEYIGKEATEAYETLVKLTEKTCG